MLHILDCDPVVDLVVVNKASLYTIVVHEGAQAVLGEVNLVHFVGQVVVPDLLWIDLDILKF